MAKRPIPKIFRGDRFVSKLSELQEANHNSIVGYLNAPLMSIEEAVTSVVPLVPDVKRYAATAMVYCRQNTVLTKNESAAIYLYTIDKDFYASLNTALRAENSIALGPWFPFLKLFLTALNKLPSSTSTVWRGVGENIDEVFVEGDVHTWLSVNSCSSRVNVAGSFAGLMGTLFCIHAIRGKDITLYSAYPTEEEIVLLPGTQLRIKAVLPNSDGLSVVNLEEWWGYVWTILSRLIDSQITQCGLSINIRNHFFGVAQAVIQLLNIHFCFLVSFSQKDGTSCSLIIQIVKALFLRFTMFWTRSAYRFGTGRQRTRRMICVIGMNSKTFINSSCRNWNVASLI